MIIEAQVGEIFGLISLVIDTDGRSLLKFKGVSFVFLSSNFTVPYIPLSPCLLKTIQLYLPDGTVMNTDLRSI
jgi:hypothetical protein